MKNLINVYKIAVYLGCLIILSGLPVFSVFAATFPLEITNIKPAGTGSPAITSTHRIFKAYPGIEYNIRAAVVGGLYPYTYSLSNAPSGMRINSATGEISWPNPQSNATDIRLSVTDSEDTDISTTWSITVTTNNFHFVDASYSGTESGSITQPYSSLENMLIGTDGQPATDIIYFRTGDYNLLPYNDSNNKNTKLSSNPKAWISHPDNAGRVVMHGSGSTGSAAYIFPDDSDNLYFDGIDFSGVIGYALYLTGGKDYITIRRSVFDGLTPPDSTNNNYGFIHNSGSYDQDFYNLTIQDNEFKDWHGAAAIGSLYALNKILLENNYIHDPSSSTSPSGIGVTLGLAIKAYLSEVTIRGNIIDMDIGTIVGTSVNNWFWVEHMDMTYNYFSKSTTTGSGIQFNGQQSSHGPNIYHNISRNTIVDKSASFRFDPCNYDSGPFYVNDNTLIVTDNQLNRSCIDYGSNLDSVEVDDNGKLLPAYSANVGTYGWQLADGSTPMEGLYTPLADGAEPVSTPAGFKLMSN